MSGLDIAPGLPPGALAATAFIAAALWTGVVFGLSRAPGASWVEFAGIAFHLALLPLVGQLLAPEWARAMGYAWIALDVAVSVFVLNARDAPLAMVVRLGGHVPAAVWIAFAALMLGGAASWLGLILALCLGGHSLVAPYFGRPVLLYAAGLLMVLWLLVVGSALM